MRNDMFEVIIERPRGGAGWVKPGRGEENSERAWERAPQKQGMRPYRRSKYLSENLAPLKRFLARNVGRPWRVVSSEIAGAITMTSAVQKHVMDHVRQMVEENPVFVKGLPHHPHASGGKYLPLRSHPRWPDFYVCPRTGLLRQAPHYPRPKKPNPSST
ncbi:MAG: hypothetical protein IPK82_31295 [Polyangiaceae bacterium]|nr:hypothetical protein [Polyangiaceae bacterium]